MLKFPLTILLMLIIGLQTFSKWLVFLDFEINKDFIAATLCVNRETRGSCCKGKCYLNKQLARDTDQQQPINNTQKDEVHFFSEELVSWTFHQPVSFERAEHPYLCRKSQEYFISVFQPPQA
ncbi:MAG: hypothetical protein Q8918_14060 [Bacteroidota bacterium]|nr:hypothetical protein [Bacteroidota bacterium]MDP4251226.1 hypothetical protein [Bacteroidota bacterium]